MRFTSRQMRAFVAAACVAVACGNGASHDTDVTGAGASGGTLPNGGSGGSGATSAGKGGTAGHAGSAASIGGSGGGAGMIASAGRGGSSGGTTMNAGGATSSGAGQSGTSTSGAAGGGAAGASGGAGGHAQAGSGAMSAGTGGVSATGGMAGLSGVAGSSGGGQAGAGSTHAGTWRIMPLGDSITGTTCYPQLLSEKLKDGGHTNFAFVGTNLNNQSCTDGAITNAPTVMTEGHGGYILSCLTGDYTSNCSSKGMPSELATWLAAKPPPDVVLVHFGTNDVWNGIGTSAITTAYTHLLASIRGANPNVIVFVAKILPMHPNGCTDATSSCPNNGVIPLDAAIPAWAAGASTSASPVYVVDIYASVGDETAYMPNSELTTDGVHPNPKGSGKVADAWLAALATQSIP